MVEWNSYKRDFIKLAINSGKERSYIESWLKYARRLNKAGLPIVFDVEHFSLLVGVRLKYLYGVANSSGKFYRSFRIVKRSGGFRHIEEPLPLLKGVQRWVLDNILYRCEVHKVAKGFVPGQGIKKNALLHRRMNVVVRLDVSDFFPSIKVDAVYDLFRSLGYSTQLSGLLASICTKDGFLPQGSPASPCISNLIFKDYDVKILKYCQKRGIRYTRYADDLCFSGDINIKKFIRGVRRIFQKSDFRLNGKKTLVMHRWTRQQVTGVVVNEKCQVPRELRRHLRQCNYYIGKYGIENHLGVNKIADPYYVNRLLGYCSFVLQMNPSDRDALALRETLRAL